MQFFRQIKNEIKTIFSSKFILVFVILVIAGSIIVPVISALTTSDQTSTPGGPIMYARAEAAIDYAYPGKYGDYGNGQDPITVGDVTVTSDNPFYWQLSNIISEQQYLQTDGSMFTTPAALDLAVNLLDEELQYYAQFAASITTYQDYRYDLAYTGTSALYDEFIFSRVDNTDHDALREAANYRLYLDQETFDAKYYNITATERLAALDKAEGKLDQIYDIVINNNFPAYIDLMIGQQNDNIANLEAQIEVYEETLREHPEQEEMLNSNIEDCQKQIALIQDSTIPVLEYRREKNIIPYSGMWQDTALNEITNAQNQLQYFYIMTEEQFNQDQWSAMQYGTYQNYLDTMNKQKDELNNTILIAQNCLDEDKPDMRYVPTGSRFITMNFLSYSIVIAIFAVLLGGWLIASEFQSGTIRLLMIRPRTRTKILMSKFLAALGIALALYVACAILNILMNGILFGFGDFANPNMTVSGSVGFFAYYLPKFIACSVTIIFAFSVAFMMSVLVKNIAVAIIVPVVCYIGSVILQTILAYTVSVKWIAWTPIPYLQLSSFFQPEAASGGMYYVYTLNPVASMINNGVPLSLAYGISLLLVLSGLCVFFSILSFRKRDITH